MICCILSTRYFCNGCPNMDSLLAFRCICNYDRVISNVLFFVLSLRYDLLFFIELKPCNFFGYCIRDNEKHEYSLHAEYKMLLKQMPDNIYQFSQVILNYVFHI